METPPRPRPQSLPFLLLLPNLVTILGLCAGLTALRFVLQGKLEMAAALIIFAALLDSFDGLLARKLNAASRFGAELDSLADFVNFGVVPPFLVHALALSEASDISWTAPLIFAVCACLRLARFNVNRDAPVVGRAHFVGVPAPAGALLGMLPAFVGFSGLADPSRAPWLVAPWLALVGLLMISRLRTVAPKGLRISRERAPWLLVGVALVVGLTFSRFWILMILIDAAYLATLAYAALVRRRRAAPPGD
jgi:CDP-diacylglycerol--serine O-phosphatidyltransferase